MPIENGQTSSVEQASDAQFQAFVKQSGIPVDDAGISEWSFDDRIRFISYAYSLGIDLPFCDQNNSESELFVVPTLATEANGA